MKTIMELKYNLKEWYEYYSGEKEMDETTPSVVAELLREKIGGDKSEKYVYNNIISIMNSKLVSDAIRMSHSIYVYFRNMEIYRDVENYIVEFDGFTRNCEWYILYSHMCCNNIIPYNYRNDKQLRYACNTCFSNLRIAEAVYNLTDGQMMPLEDILNIINADKIDIVCTKAGVSRTTITKLKGLIKKSL